MRLGLLASHTGTNLQAILDACAERRIEAVPAVVISNNSNARALERARSAAIPAVHLSSRTHPGDGNLDLAMLGVLREHRVDLVVAVGYMKKFGPATLEAYRHRIINIHPSLLPKYGGQGMYGIKVHEAVIASGDPETGVSIHLVDGDYDTGPLLAQRRVPVEQRDTPATLAARVLDVEHELLVDTLARIASGQLAIAGLRS